MKKKIALFLTAVFIITALGCAMTSCSDDTTDTDAVTTTPEPDPDPIAKFTSTDVTTYFDEPIKLGDIFAAIGELSIPIKSEGITVTATTVEGDGTAAVSSDAESWAENTVSFDKAGKYELSITDGEFCIPTVAVVTAADPIEEVILTDIEGVTVESLSADIRANRRLKVLHTGELLLTHEQYTELRGVNPDVKIVSKITFENIELDFSQSEVDISKKKIKDKEAFDALLSLVPGGVKLVMCDCGYKNEEMAELRDKHPELDIVWRVYMGRWNLRTDDEAFSVMIYTYDYTRMTSKDIEVLKYCTRLKALDVGHQAITDLSVLSNLTELRVLILADNRISDVTPLATLTNLEYLELFVNKIDDITPLATLTNLVDLNLGWNWYLDDISAIYELKQIERLWLPTTKFTGNRRLQTEVNEQFPNTTIVYFNEETSIGNGWRTHPRYKPMRQMFLDNKYDENFASYK